jgi:hypothetical protein
VGRLTMELEAGESLGLAPLGPEARRQVILTLASSFSETARLFWTRTLPPRSRPCMFGKAAFTALGPTYRVLDWGRIV